MGAKDAIFKLDATDILNTNSPVSNYHKMLYPQFTFLQFFVCNLHPKRFASASLPSSVEQKEQCMGTYYDEVLTRVVLLGFIIDKNY